MKIMAISGSLRRGSFNTALLHTAIKHAPAGIDFHVASIADVPLYHGDVESEKGIPPSVVALKNALIDADALLLATPEYNASIPGVLKNTIDWMSRPDGDIGKVFGNKPVALIGASTGKGGTRLAQVAFLPVFRVLNMRPFFKQFYVDLAKKQFDENGQLTDEKTVEVLTKFLSEFAQFIES